MHKAWPGAGKSLSIFTWEKTPSILHTFAMLRLPNKLLNHQLFFPISRKKKLWFHIQKFFWALLFPLNKGLLFFGASNIGISHGIVVKVGKKGIIQNIKGFSPFPQSHPLKCYAASWRKQTRSKSDITCFSFSPLDSRDQTWVQFCGNGVPQLLGFKSQYLLINTTSSPNWQDRREENYLTSKQFDLLMRTTRLERKSWPMFSLLWGRISVMALLNFYQQITHIGQLLKWLAWIVDSKRGARCGPAFP